jgi:hypothetical protein
MIQTLVGFFEFIKRHALRLVVRAWLPDEGTYVSRFARSHVGAIFSVAVRDPR